MTAIRPAPPESPTPNSFCRTSIFTKFDDVIQIVRKHPFWLTCPIQLQDKPDQILQDIILAKSEGTVNSYVYKCQQFFSWLKVNGVPQMLPVSEPILATYLSHVKDQSNSESVLATTVASLKWLHILINVKINPLDSAIIQHILISGRRQLHQPPVQKHRSLSQFRIIIDLLTGPDSSLLDLRMACYVSIKYALFLRHEEMAAIKANHFSVLQVHKGISAFIPKSKTMFSEMVKPLTCTIQKILIHHLKSCENLWKPLIFKSGKMPSCLLLSPSPARKLTSEELTSHSVTHDAENYFSKRLNV
ncbi:uncharacterized protein LOC110987946 [Acanthaster planci]|uniref:Uncharacterized protein LOC110987946 n=1 Tax=Acanthaster planci TaxID=133434 RepID=A0A8B7ZTJ1_ACAPL|nr:uncharacterized protein LOC110987946 [Acanthaster planci]XP_022106801.1 uncharacterized protein LOC110987946 [Acanthaster planci]